MTAEVKREGGGGSVVLPCPQCAEQVEFRITTLAPLPDGTPIYHARLLRSSCRCTQPDDWDEAAAEEQDTTWFDSHLEWLQAHAIGAFKVAQP